MRPRYNIALLLILYAFSLSGCADDPMTSPQVVFIAGFISATSCAKVKGGVCKWSEGVLCEFDNYQSTAVAPKQTMSPSLCATLHGTWAPYEPGGVFER